MSRRPQQRQQQVVYQEGQSFASSVLTNVVKPLVRNPKSLPILLLYLLGLFALFFAPAPVKITKEALAQYKFKLNEADSVMVQLSEAHRRLTDAQIDQSEVTGWFWRFRPEIRAQVLARQPPIDAAKKEIAALDVERMEIVREAKAALGLWSDAGLEESRELLWDNFKSGKAFAQRQTFWDAIFTLIQNRNKEEFFLSSLLQIVATAVVNYSIGTALGIFSFILRLPSLVSSFAPSWPSAILFFVVASVAALSLLISYLTLLVTGGAAIVVTTFTVVNEYRGQLEAGERRRPEAVRYTERYENSNRQRRRYNAYDDDLHSD